MSTYVGPGPLVSFPNGAFAKKVMIVKPSGVPATADLGPVFVMADGSFAKKVVSLDTQGNAIS